LKKYFGWFDKLTTNGKKSMIAIYPTLPEPFDFPFVLSLSKDEESKKNRLIDG